jgi:hypothetical protein
MAVVAVALPVYLGHWLWAQHGLRNRQELGSAIRRGYLYLSLGAFVLPCVVAATDLLTRLFAELLGTVIRPSVAGDSAYDTSVVREDMIMLAVLGLLWLYHRRLLVLEEQSIPTRGDASTLRRVYLLGLTAVGGAMASLGTIHVLRWILLQYQPQALVIGGGQADLASEAPVALVGVALWLSHWRSSQKLGAALGRAEQRAALRQFYLQSSLFVAVLAVLANSTLILAGGLRRLFDLPPGGDLRGPLPVVACLLVTWWYHAHVAGSAPSGEAAERAVRPYPYVVAAAALGVGLVGVTGDLSIVMRWLIQGPLTATDQAGLGRAEGEQIALFSAAIICALPVWAAVWRGVQRTSEPSEPGADAAHESVVRKAYLYFYLYVAGFAALSGTVYVVYRLLASVLGVAEPPDLATRLSRSIAAAVTGAGLWSYHALVLRRDAQIAGRTQRARLAEALTVVADSGDGSMGRAVADALRREIPGLPVETVGLGPQAAASLGPGDPAVAADRLARAAVIVGSWQALSAIDEPQAAAALMASRAHKLLLPVKPQGYEWVGVEPLSTADLLPQTVAAVRQVVAGQPISPQRPLFGAAVLVLVGIVVVVAAFAVLLLGTLVRG